MHVVVCVTVIQITDCWFVGLVELVWQSSSDSLKPCCAKGIIFLGNKLFIQSLFFTLYFTAQASTSSDRLADGFCLFSISLSGSVSGIIFSDFFASNPLSLSLFGQRPQRADVL